MINSLYPCFQHWSKKGSVYIISDTHFDDEDRELMGYTFNEKTQINRLKEKCTKNDTLIHLGDVGNPEYMNELKCWKVLVMGNHDTGQIKKYFNEIYLGPIWINKKLVLSHEPLVLKQWTWIEEEGANIAFNIHGHCHNERMYIDSYHLNLAQNIFGYTPLNLKNFIEDGFLKKIINIHRVTIDNAIERKKYE